MENGTKKTFTPGTPEEVLEQVGRRRFLRYAGFSVAMTSAILAACENKDTAVIPTQQGARAVGAPIDLGAGDIGILNYAYALEQLEAALYDAVLQTPPKGITNREVEIIKEIRNHEIVHREFFKAALGSAGIPTLTFDFSMAGDLTDKVYVINTARSLEDVGVSAYNGAGRLLSDSKNLLIAGKIVSVEARHAALLRTFAFPVGTGFFAGDDVINSNGLDLVRMPAEVLPMAQKFIKETITATQLPMM